MTRLEAYKALFPAAVLDENGYPHQFPCSFSPCHHSREHSCFENDCERQFWNEETGFKFVKEVSEI